MIFIPFTAENYQTANSYLSVEEADILISNQLHSEKWQTLDTEAKQFLLIQSSLAVDSAYAYDGVKVSDEQVLKFPRKKLGSEVDTSTLTIPLNVKFAVVSMAIKLSNDEAFKNITSETIGKLSRAYAGQTHELGDDVVALLKPLRAKTIKVNSQ